MDKQSLRAFLFGPFPAFFLIFATSMSLPGQKDSGNEQPLRGEETRDYYEIWLKEDVVYIITAEERQVFERLSAPEEKEQFIEQFWRRRDPDPRTARNEFKEEHYRRIAYANERFASGQPGWKTDRGKIYIMHGPPDQIERYPAGQYYQRSTAEGGGATSTYPYEVWHYRHLPEVANDIELEFVDPTMTKEYRLARYPEEKDALLYAGPLGATRAEELGLAGKADRPVFNPGAHDRYPLIMLREKDLPFQRLERFSLINRPPEIKYPDLKETVNVDVTYESLPFRVRPDYFQLDAERVLVPITLQVENQELSFVLEQGLRVAKAAVYGIITSLTNQVVQEFEDDMMTSFQPESFQAGLRSRSVYQTLAILNRNMRYRLDIVVKDLNSGKIGVLRKAVSPSPAARGKLSLSSVILSDHIKILSGFPEDREMFVLGDVLLYPSLTHQFSKRNSLGVYLQAYNLGIDQTTLRPALEVDYQISRNQETVAEFSDRRGESTQFFSTQRVVLIRELPSKTLVPGRYHLRIQVRDLLQGQTAEAVQEFEIYEGSLAAQ